MGRTKRAIAVRNKERGKELERDAVKFFQGMGLVAERTWGSTGASLGLQPDVDVVVRPSAEITHINGVFFQCKMKKRWNKDLIPAKGIHGVIIRQDKGEPYMVLRLGSLTVEQVISMMGEQVCT